MHISIGGKNTVGPYLVFFGDPYRVVDLTCHAETDILYLNLLGQPLVVLFKLEDAVQFLDKQGAKTSDRPTFDFFFE